MSFYASYPLNGVTGPSTNPSVGTNGAVAPASSTEIGGVDGSGNLIPVSVDALGNVNVTAVSLPLPAGAATSANQATEIASLSSIDGKLGSLGQKTMAGSAPVVIASDQSAIPVSAASLPLPTGAATSALQTTGNSSLSSIDGKTPALGQAVMASSSPVVIASDQSAVPVSAASLPLPAGAATSANQTNKSQMTQITDGSIQVNVKPLGTQVISTDNGLITNSVIHGLTTGGGGGYVDVKVNPSGALAVDGSGVTQPISAVSLPLPAGAATSANQATEIASLSSIDGKLVDNYGVSTGALRTAAQIGNASGAADFGSGVLSAQTIRAVLATDQPAVATKSPVNSNGNSPGSGTVSTAATLTAPANTVGFILMNLDTSSSNIRYRIGAAATSSSGQQLQPGRDTGYIPCSANISICAESGTQNYDVQWILSA